MDRHRGTNTGSLLVLNLQPNRFQGVQLDCFHSQITLPCGIGQIIGGGGVTGREYLGLFLIVIEHGITVSGYSWCHRYRDPTKNDH